MVCRLKQVSDRQYDFGFKGLGYTYLNLSAVGNVNSFIFLTEDVIFGTVIVV